MIKLDIEKAFNKVDWAFLDMVLKAKGFGKTWRKWIKGFISSTNFLIIIKGHTRGKIKAAHGLRQGDPLSLFLFIIIVDCFSHMMIEAHDRDYIKGLPIGMSSLSIHYLLFANATILFTEIDPRVIENLLGLMEIFEEAFSLNISHQKSVMMGINM